jgi:hypothetical protein
MNWLGKVFVVSIMVMSLFFAGLAVVAYATHKNWKEAVMLSPSEATGGKQVGLKYQLDTERARRKGLEDEVARLTEQLASEKTARVQAVAKLETERSELNKRYTEQANINAGLVQQTRKADEAMLATHNTLEDMRKQVEMLRTEIRTAQTDRDDQFKQVVQLTDDLHQVQGLLTTVKAQNVELGEQNAHMAKVMERNGVSPTASISGVPPPVDGVVLASSRDGLVEISLGSDDGMERGHKLEVYRGAKYLGRIEVWQTSPDKSVARILPEFRKGPIAKEDRVATRLN